MKIKNKIKNLLYILFREKHPPQPVICALFNNEEDFLTAAKKAGSSNLKDIEAVSPYPVHGLEEALKIKRSWIPWVSFIFGLTGMAGGFLLTWFTSVVSWPLVIGGKPLFSLPAFIPIIFECTILFSALTTVIALFYACGLPKINPPVLDKDLTCHKFALYCPLAGNSAVSAEKTFKEWGAQSVIQGDF